MAAQKKSYSVSIDTELMNKIDEYAQQVSRSRSDVINMFLIHYIFDGKKYPPIPTERTPFAWKKCASTPKEENDDTFNTTYSSITGDYVRHNTR